MLVLAGSGAASTGTPDERRLAARYVPIVALKALEEGVPACTGTEPSKGEHYAPTVVETVLGNEEVTLRGPDGNDAYATVDRAPTARDLAGKGREYWLDLPGDAISPRCSYLEFFERAAKGRPAVAYAHVATQPDRPGKLALQYWLYYVFNDYNNKHESDWEMIQLVFDADDAAEALRVGPSEVGFSQHEGAERADWEDDKLEKVGDRPVVYPGAGSHANYFSSSLWLGRSAEEGIGCDDTTGPSRRVPTRPILVPHAPDADDDALAWLGYEGHWGERQRSFNQGPTGPNVKGQWTEPITWAEEWRSGSVAIPGGSSLGPTATGFFCGAVANVSTLVNVYFGSPLVAIGLGLVLLALLAIPLWRTRWRPGVTEPLEQHRYGGQILQVAAKFCAGWPGSLALIGVVFLPLSLLGSLLRLLEGGYEGNGVTLRLTSFQPLGVYMATVFVLAATAVFVDGRARGAPVGAGGAWRSTLRRAGTLAWLVVRVTLVAFLLVITIVGIPFAIRYLVRAVLSPQACVLEGLSAKQALARSSSLVTGRFWRVLVLGGVVYLAGLAVGPLLGGVLIATTPVPIWIANLAAAVVHAVALPFVGVALTLLFYDLRLSGESPEQVPAPASAPA